MNISILHGTNQVASRNGLQELISKTKQAGVRDIVQLNGETLTLEELTQAIESKSLFGNERLLVIENLLTRVRSKLKETLMNYLAKQEMQGNVILWEKKEVTSSSLRNIGKSAHIRVFTINPTIFRFLDAILPKNTAQALGLYHECLRKDEPQLVFYMLSRRLTLLISLHDNPEELHSMPPWQKQRMIRQTQRFPLEKLITLHEKMYRTDVSVKTGRNILPLASMLDLILSDI